MARCVRFARGGELLGKLFKTGAIFCLDGLGEGIGLFPGRAFIIEMGELLIFGFVNGQDVFVESDGSLQDTILWCSEMSGMGEMPMPGDWTMSMMWMRMSGQTWPGIAASFLGMWIVMMVAMMLPSLLPMLLRYRQTVERTTETRLAWLTVLAGAGYFFVWALLGLIVFPLGVLIAAAEMRLPELARAVPIAAGISCCAGLTTLLLVIGVMDIRAMALVTAAITAERLAPAGERVARATGFVIVVAGVFLLARAAGVE